MIRLALLTVLTGTVLALAPSGTSAADQCAAVPTGRMTFNPCAVLDNSRVHYANEPLRRVP